MRPAPANFEDIEYLRVLTPQTIDGANLKTNELGNTVFKETRLPMTAKKHLEQENEARPNHLKHKLETVTAEPKKEEHKKGLGRPKKEKPAESVE